MFATYDDAAVSLGVLDTLFMSFYAIGLYIFGYLGERFNLRFILAMGTLCNALTLFTFGCLLPWIECKTFTVWALVWSLNGLSQVRVVVFMSFLKNRFINFKPDIQVIPWK